MNTVNARCIQRSGLLLVVDWHDRQHGRLMGAVARSAVRRTETLWLAPSLQLRDTLREFLDAHPSIRAVAIPQSVPGVTRASQWATRIRAVLTEIHLNRARVFKAADNRSRPDALSGVGWTCRPESDPRPADVHIGSAVHGASGASVLAAAHWAANTLNEPLSSTPLPFLIPSPRGSQCPTP